MAADGISSLVRSLRESGIRPNANLLFGLDVADVQRRIKRDRVSQARLEYANDPKPTRRAYGPTTRAQFLRHLTGQTGPA